MKKHLRMLCMGLAAAATSMAFAQEPQDFTSKLWNYDFEKGPHGWDITGESADQNYNVWMPQVKGDVKAEGYHGHNNIALEIWTSGALLKDNSVSQTVTDLPDGTYVFGAYMMATNQSKTPNRELIEGVWMFANDQKVPVATNIVEGVPDSIWAHAAKFNVAVEVTGGTLTVGAKCENTNINFTTIDNATLWYFGTMDPATALDEMAKIDMQRSLAIADTCVVLRADAVTKAYLEEKMQAARELTGAAEAWTADEELWWGMRQVRKSAKAYQKLADALAAAEVVYGMDWSTDIDETVAALEALRELIDTNKEAYNEGSVIYSDVDSVISVLAEAVAMVELDGVYTLLETYEALVDSIDDLEGEEIGEYSESMIEQAVNLVDAVYEELSLVGEISATEVKANCEKLFAKIQDIVDNPINYSEFPIFLHSAEEPLPNQTGTGPFPVLEGAYEINMPAGTDMNGVEYRAYNNLIEYKSQLFRFREPLKSVRFIIHAAGSPAEVDKNGNPHICISGFAMFDENGNAIELTTDNVVSNATENEGQGVPGMLDYNPSTFFHSLWRTGTPEPHYIEVDLPDGEYSAFYFKMLSYDNSRSRVFPREMEITYVSPKVTELQQALVNARKANPMFGTAPGFYNVDPSAYLAALEEGDAIAEKEGATDSELDAAIEKINSIFEEIQEKGINMPDPDKKYRIISGEPRFFSNQNIMKALTLHTDTVYGDWLWWETAHADSARQEFILEPCAKKGDSVYYAFKHVQTGLYLGEIRDSLGNLKEANRFVFTERRDSFWLMNLGQGQFGIMASDGNSRKQLNMEFHNNGAWSDVVANYGAIKGVKSYIHTWGSSANQSSAWFFREMATLPHEAKSISDLNFRSDVISVYEGINVVTLTADKECAFADLTLYNTFGAEVAVNEMKVDGKVATIKLESNIETLAFSFTNNEGVAKVTIDGVNEYRGETPEYLALETAYNNAVGVAPVEGTEVGQSKNLDEYNDALAAAEALLEDGGETEELVAAKAAIDSALAHLEYNLPVAGQNYFIQSALPWMTRWNSEMDIFVKDNDDYVYWNYVNIKNLNHQWQFIECGEQNGMPAYYLKNVGTELYLSTPRPQPLNNANGGRLFVTEDIDSVGTGGYYAAPFNIHFLTDGKVAIADAREGNANGSWCLHPNNHQNGTGYVAHGYMISWGKHDAASAMRIVSAEKVISDFMTGIEDVEIAGEQIAPAKKGVYDLYGRRIMTPAATGIYIVDGKKRVIKK